VGGKFRQTLENRRSNGNVGGKTFGKNFSSAELWIGQTLRHTRYTVYGKDTYARLDQFRPNKHSSICAKLLIQRRNVIWNTAQESEFNFSNVTL